MTQFFQHAQRITVLLALVLVVFGCGPVREKNRDVDDTSNPPSTAGTTTNRAPIALDDTASMSGTSIDLNILANDSDPDGDPITITGTSAPANGSVQVLDNGTSSPADDSIRYTPNPGFFGPDSFSYTISDGLDGTANGDVMLTVTLTATGGPLVAVDDSGTTLAGNAKNLPVLDNDSGGNGNPLKIVSVSAANNGSSVRADNGTVTDPGDDYIVYIPGPGFSGADTFTYSVTDGDSIATAAVNITVTAPIPATLPSNPPPAPPAPGFIGGSVVKGPVNNALIQIFAITADGLPASSIPVAQSVTDVNGNWSILDPLPGQHRLVIAKGGQFVDEAHSFNNPATRRVITLPDTSTLEGLMPATADYLALTVYSNALLLKSRSETTQGNFADVYDKNRTTWTRAFGFDLVTTAPASPIDPDPSATTAALQYALAAGGAANVLNAIGTELGIVVPRPDTIQALVRDLTACGLDGQDINGVISVDVSGVPTAISTSSDLNLEILRYRNNHFSDFGNTPLPVINMADCAMSGALPDTAAPLFSGAIPSINIANTAPNGIAASNPAIQNLLLSVVAEDDRDGVVTVSYDAPPFLPIGETLIRFTTADNAGNTSVYTTAVNVVSGNATPDVTPIGAVVAVQDTPFSADLSFFFADADGDALTYTVDGLPPSMSLDETTGIITGTPTNYDAIIAPFTVTATVSDGVLTATDTFTFGVVNTNDTPILFSPIVDSVASLGTALLLNPGNHFYDADGDALSFSVSGLPATSGLVFDPLTGSLSGTPVNSDASASPLTISVTATDGVSVISDTFVLSVLNDNNAPTVISPLGARLAIEDAPFFFDVSTAFDDPDRDGLSFSANGLPASLSLDSATGVISGTPTNEDALTAPLVISVSASDGGLSVSDILTINVVNTNDAPTLITPAGLQFAAQDAPYSRDVSTNFNDIDNDTLTFSASGLPDTLSIDAATGIISGTPDAAAVAASPLTVTVTASDGSDSVSDTFNLNVSLMNTAPVLVAPIGMASGTQGSVLALNLANNFSDPNGNSLSFSLSGLPAGSGLSLGAATGVLGGIPNNTDAMTSPITLIATASDGALNVSESFVLTIANVNDAPTVVASIVPPLVTQDSPFSIDVSGNFEDVDGQPLSFSASGLPVSLSLNLVTGIISGTPVNADVLASPISITITASDGALTVQNSFVLNVINVNDAPALDTPIVPGPAREGSPFSLNLNGSFSDPDNEALRFTLSGLPSGTGLTLDSVAGFLAGTPTNNDALASPLTLTVTASDGSLSASNTFTLTVTNVNDAPVVLTPVSPQVATQGSPITLNVTGSFDDPDGDALSFSTTGLPASLTIDPVTGIVSGTPTNADALASPYSVTVTASDGTLGVDATFSLTVSNINDAPTVIGAIGPQVGTQDSIFALNVSGNFDDPDGDAPDFSATGLPASLTIDPVTGIVSGTPTNSDALASPYSVTVTASDGTLGVDATFSLTVSNINDAPTVIGAIGPQVGTQDSIFALNVSGNFDDPDGDLLSFSATGLPVSLTLNPTTGVISGTPTNADYLASPFAVDVTASDASDAASDSFTLTINNVNDAPTLSANISDQSGTQGTLFSLDVSGNFDDADNDTLSFAATGLPPSLTLNSTNGVISGTPGNDDWLTSSFAVNVTASDASDSVADGFTLTINNVNDAPTVATAIGAQSGTQDAALSLNVSGNFDDIDNDTLVFTATGLPATLTLSPTTGVISGTPTNADYLASPFAVDVTASDASDAASDSFTLTINNVNDAPTLSANISDQSGTQGTLFSLDVSGNFDDADNDTLSFAATGLPPSLTLNPTSGVISGTPSNADWLASPFAVNVTASDASDSVADGFTLTINNVNDAPTVATAIGAQSGTQDAAFSLNVSGNFDDIDNDTLVFTATGLPATLTLSPTTGVISGTPTNDDYLASPFAVNVTASDASDSVADAFTLTITNLNDAPTLTANISDQSGTQGTLISLDVSGNFDDIDSDTLSYSATGLPPSLTLNPTSGVISGTPSNADWLASPFAVNVTASDASDSVADGFTLTINNVNDAPTVATAIGAQSGTQDAAFSLNVSGNFDDIDNDTLVFTATGLPATLTLSPTTGVISGTPTNDDYLASPFAVNVTASDASDSVADAFTLTITNVNDAPTLTANISDQSGTQGTPFSLDVSGNFDDIDNDTLTYTVSGLPSGTGITLNSATGVFSGAPTHIDATSSPLLVTVTAEDSALSVDGSFTFTIADINEAPFESTPIPPATAFEAVPFVLDISENFIDPDLDVLDYAISGLPGGTGLVIDPLTGEITGLPTSADVAASPILITVTVQDPAPLSVTTSFTLTVDSQADVDVTMIVNDAVPMTGEIITITVTLNNYGPSDATGLSVQVPLPAGLSFASSSDSVNYNSTTGIWSGISVNNGGNETLDINASVTATAIEFLLVEAQIIAADQHDPDNVDADLLDIVVVGAGTNAEWQGGDAGGPSDWSIDNNWVSGSVPGPFDDVEIPSTANDPVLDSARSVARIEVRSGASLELNSQTLSVYGEAKSDGTITGDCATSLLYLVAGKFNGALPALEVAGPVETNGSATITCDLTISGGRLRMRDDVFVAGDFATSNTGILLMRDGGKELHVDGDVLFDGGNHATPVSGKSPLSAGIIFAKGDFTQDGNSFSFAAEKDHMVVLNGPGLQTVYLKDPDNSNPDEDDQPLTGSRFARLRIDKDAADGMVDFISDAAVLKYLEITEDFSPVLTSSTGNKVIAGGIRIKDILLPQTSSATFDALPLVLIEGDDLKELDGVLFTNMDPDVPQISIIRPDLDNLHDGRSFNNLVFDTLPNLASGGAYIFADNTNNNPTKNLTLEVNTSYPLHGEPWTGKLGNFDIVWGLATDDTDGDGLADADEFMLLTDPTDPDTDDDGLGDGLEVDIGGDPFVPESKVFFVDAIGGNDASDGLSWANAVQTNSGLFAGPLSAVTGTPAEPIHVLYATGTYDPMIIVGRQNMIMVGSLGESMYLPMQPYDSVFGPGASSGVLVDNSQNILLLGLGLSGANNVGGNGGGLVLQGTPGSDVIARKIEIFGNHADLDGGGFFVAAGSYLTLENAVVNGNSSGGQGVTAHGGAGGAVYGGLAMRDSVIADNRAIGASADDGGGGLLIENTAAVSITDSMLLANYANNYGGASLIKNIGASVTIKNNLIIANAVDNATGAGFEIMDIDLGYPLLIESNTMAHNQATILEDISGGMNLTNAMFTETRNNILFDNQDGKTGDRVTDNYMDASGTATIEYNNISKDPTGGANGNQDEDPLFIDGFYLDALSLSIDAGGTTAALAGLDAPYTTDKDGAGDTGTLDQGYHYMDMSLGNVKDVVVVSSACYAPGELTMVIRPRVDGPTGGGSRVPMGPGQLVTVEENALTPTGRIEDESTITNLKPDGGGTRIAMDEGTGDYRFTVVNVSVINDEVEIDVFVNHELPKTVKSPKTDTIPGC